MSESKRNFPLDLRRRTFSLIRPSLRDHRAGENENPREAAEPRHHETRVEQEDSPVNQEGRSRERPSDSIAEGGFI
jgi:hypothetical protein